MGSGKVLVTGGAGYIGSHCCKALARAGFEPVVFDNLTTGHRDLVRWGDLVEGDIRDRTALNAAFADHKPVAVMHFAALSLVGQSVTDPAPYWDVNIGGSLNILNAMRAHEVPAIVFSSTAAVYGDTDVALIGEDQPKRPTSPYGTTKLAVETMMDQFDTAYGLKSARLRYFNACGADGDCETGEDHTPETHLIPLVLDVALGRRAEIAVFGSDYPTPDGTAIRDYIHVEDLASAHLAALNHLLDGGSTCAANLGTGQGASVAEIIAAAEKAVGKPVARRMADRRAGDPARLVADPALAAKLFGWKAQASSMDRILTDAWAWHRKRFG
ncbi:MAG: UDP-glucose 4-epimerase GalE [Notoacmeibacter sp.]|nr:UDP-glucose 4-epimerase GalE [Notoacmeibacter sp.]